jgi:lysophospholipase L1-like esterase
VTHVIVLESTNDIGMAFESDTPTVEEIIAGHVELIERVRARGLKIYGGTLAPFEGAFYHREVGEQKRLAFNEWMRTSGAYDAVIDFDAAVRDPAAPSKFREDYQSGDWLHPSDAGYRAMAQAIDLELFDER